MHEGTRELAGTSACRWYINEDIKELNILRVRLCASFRPILHSPNPRQITLHARIPGDYPMKKLFQFKPMNVDLLPNHGSLFRCEVTIWRLTPGQDWWVICCPQCGRPSVPVDSASAAPETYRCSNAHCPCTEAMLQYLLCLLGSDATGEAEFGLLGKIAQNMIGLSPEQAIRNNSTPGVPITNLGIAAARLRHMPPEIAAVASWKYIFLIHVTANSFQRGWGNFNVCAIEAAYPPE